MSRLLAPVLVVLVLLAGCTSRGSEPDGDDASASTPSGTASSTPTPTPVPTGPACDTVWSAGDVLPDDYEQCVEEGAAGVQDVVECTDGPPLVVFDDELYGRPGEKIRASDVSPVQDTEEFGALYSECTGE